MKRYIALISFLCIITSCLTVFAEDLCISAKCITDADKSEFTIEGKSSGGLGDTITVVVLKNDYSIENEVDGCSNAVNFGETVAENSDGKFEYKFVLDDSTEKGDYNVYLTSSKSGENTIIPIYQTNSTDKLSALSVLNNATSAEDVGNVIKEYYKDLYFDINDYNAVGNKKSVVDSIIYASITKEKAENILDASNKFTKALNIVKITGNSRYIIENNYENLGVDISLFNNMNDNARNWAYEILDNMSFQSEEDMKNGIDEAVFTGIVSKPLNYSEIKNALLNTYKDFLNLDLSDYNMLSNKNEVFIQMLGRTYSGKQDIIDSFYRIVKNLKSSGKNNGSSGSGGGGSSVGEKISSNPVAPPVINQNPSENLVFADINDASWAEKYIVSLNKSGVIKGADGYFYPNNQITRAEFTAMLMRGLNLLETESNIPFVDVEPSSWYYGSVCCAYANNIVLGDDSNKFNPQSFITREDMSVIIARCINGQSADKNTGFTDNGDISDYARESITKIKSLGIINGMNDGSFAPKNNSTRAEAAKMIYMLLEIKGGK